MNFKKIFNKLLIFIFLISIISVPNIVFAYTKKVVLGGENIGIKVNSNAGYVGTVALTIISVFALAAIIFMGIGSIINR